MKAYVSTGSSGSLLASHVHLSIPSEDVTLHKTLAGTRLRMAGALEDAAIGGPGLLGKAIYVALPPGTIATAVDISDATSVPFNMHVGELVPAVLHDEISAGLTGAGGLPAGSRTSFNEHELAKPRPWIRLVDTVQVGQVPVARLMLSPVSVGQEAQLHGARELDIILRLAPAAKTGVGPAPLACYQNSRNGEIARSLVVNPMDIPERQLPRMLPTGAVGLLVITDNQFWDPAAIRPTGSVAGDMVSAFERLAAWRCQQDLRTRVVTVSAIVSNIFGPFATDARDLQHVLRKFVTWAHATWGVAYVLLGGGARVIPARKVKFGSVRPTDAYYSALAPVNDWSEEQTIDYSAVDLQFDVSVGRLPTESEGDATNVVDKIISYERMIDPDGTLIPSSYLHRAFFVGTSWQMERSYHIRRAASAPPKDNEFFHPNGSNMAVIKVMDLLEITREEPADPDRPSQGRYAHKPGADYAKIHLPDDSTYKEIAEVIAVSSAGAVRPIPYRNGANAANHGWFLSNDAWTWIMLYDDRAELEPQKYVVRLKREFRQSQNPNREHLPNLLRIDSEGQQHLIPYREDADGSGTGWCFARDETGRRCLTSRESAILERRRFELDLNLTVLRHRLLYAFPSERHRIAGEMRAVEAELANLQRELDAGQAPTPWLVVHDVQENFDAPALDRYQLDPSEPEGSMADQEVLRKQIATDFPGWNDVSRMYEDIHDLPLADRTSPELAQFSLPRAIDKLNTGYHIVALSGHGLPNTCCNGIDTSVVSNLHNKSCHSVVFTDSCYTGTFTEDSVANRFLLNRDGGAVAYIGYTDSGTMGLSKLFPQMFFRGLANAGCLGAALDARAQLLDPALIHGGADESKKHLRRMILVETLAGDPSMTIHDCNPAVLDTPRLLSPRNGEQVSGLPGAVTLAWEDVADADLYHVTTESFDADSNSWITEGRAVQADTSWVVTFPETGSGRWRWRVIAYQRAATLGPSRPSPWSAFDCTGGTGLRAPVLLSPPAGATVRGDVQFLWKTVPGATRYSVEVQADYGSIILAESWTTVASSTVTGSSVVLSLPNNGFPFPIDCRWRVSAADNGAVQLSAWCPFQLGPGAA